MLSLRVHTPVHDDAEKVAVAARRLDRLDALVEELRKGGATHVCAVRMDVRDETSIKVGVKQVVTETLQCAVRPRDTLSIMYTWCIHSTA